MSRLRTGLLALLLLALPGIVTAAPSQFVIAWWYGPPEGADGAAYDLIAAAGFNAGPTANGPVSVAENRRVLDLFAARGITGIVMDGRIANAHPVPGPEWAATIAAVAADYAGHPALLGYYLADEPSAAYFPELAYLNEQLLAADPAHWPLINLFPTYASAEQLGTPTYEEHVQSYLDIVQPPFLCYDHYAIMDGDWERPDFYQNLEIIRAKALAAGLPFWASCLSIPHYSYRDPSEADLRWQMFSNVTYGARGVYYFTCYPPPGPDWEKGPAIIDAAGQPTVHYPQVQRLNADLAALGPLLMSLTSQGVYHSAPLPLGTVGFDSPSSPVTAVDGGAVAIGDFRHRDGSEWVLVANRSPRDAVTPTLHWRQPGGWRLYDYRTQAETMPPAGNQVTLSLGPGELAVLHRHELHHFAFGAIASPQHGDAEHPLPFTATLRAADQYGDTLADYTGEVMLGDLTGHLSVDRATLTAGVVSGLISIAATAATDRLTATAGLVTGESNPFQLIGAGDPNADNTVNVLDVVQTVGISLGTLSVGEVRLAAADSTGDGAVNVLDVIRTVNLALGAPAPAARQAPAAGRSTVVVPIIIDGAGVAGLQLDLAYDPGELTPLAARPGPLVAGRTDWVVAGNLAARPLRLLCYSNRATGVSGKGTVAEVVFRAVTRAAATSLRLAGCTVSDEAGRPRQVHVRLGPARQSR